MIRSAQHRANRNAERLRVYECGFCSGFHLTHAYLREGSR